MGSPRIFLGGSLSVGFVGGIKDEGGNRVYSTAWVQNGRPVLEEVSPIFGGLHRMLLLRYWYEH